MAHRLEAAGALNQIRAQIRTNVYRALLSDEVNEDRPMAPSHLLSVVADFLQKYDLGNTNDVFVRESRARSIDKGKLLQDVASCVDPGSPDQAVLEQLLVTARRKGRLGAPAAGAHGASSGDAAEGRQPQQQEEAQPVPHAAPSMAAHGGHGHPSGAGGGASAVNGANGAAEGGAAGSGAGGNVARGD